MNVMPYIGKLRQDDQSPLNRTARIPGRLAPWGFSANC